MKVELLADLDRAGGWMLVVDGAEQSYVDIDDPTHLEFEYMQHMALVVDSVFPPEQPLRALHLGGGACTMPRWLAATRPGSVQTVAESSADVLAAVASLGAVPATTMVVEDAATVLAGVASGSFDLAIWDLYAGPRAVIASLSLEGVTEMRRALAETTSLLLLNVSDAPPFDVVRPVVAALLDCFDDVVMLAEPTTLRGRRSGNCVLAAATSRLPAPMLGRRASGAPVRARMLAGRELHEFVGDAVPATADRPLPEADETLGRGFL